MFELDGDLAFARQRREDVAAWLAGRRCCRACWRCLRSSSARPEARTELDYPIITIQEAGLDGFWIHRVLRQEGIQSHVVDAASIATSRRRRRAKTDKIDGETLLRALAGLQARRAAGVRDGDCAVAGGGRPAAGCAANGKHCSASGSCIPTGSKDFCLRKAYPITRRYGATGASGLKVCRRETDGRCQ